MTSKPLQEKISEEFAPDPNKPDLEPIRNSYQAEGKDPFTNEARWVDNSGQEVHQVFGFNVNAELVNGRAAMVGFIMLILTELIFHGAPVTKTIFGIN